MNTHQMKAFQALNCAWNLNCNDKFHNSKIILWSWLQNETCNGRIYYRLGNQCSLEGIIHSLHYYMTQEERKFFSFVTSVSRKCCKFGNHVFTSKERQSAHLKLLLMKLSLKIGQIHQIHKVPLVSLNTSNTMLYLMDIHVYLAHATT